MGKYAARRLSRAAFDFRVMLADGRVMGDIPRLYELDMNLLQT